MGSTALPPRKPRACRACRARRACRACRILAVRDLEIVDGPDDGVSRMVVHFRMRFAERLAEPRVLRLAEGSVMQEMRVVI